MNFRLNPLAAILLPVILCFCINDPADAQNRLAISGRVIRYDFNPETGLWRDRGPIAGIEIILRGKQETLTAATDNSGLYRFSDLESGTYVVTINPPDSFLLTGPVGRVVELQKENAEFVNFTLRTNGRVSGEIFSGDGVPLGGIAVNLLPFEYRNSADPHPMKTVSDADGAYYFEGVPEGRYLLGIHLDGSDQHDSRYPRVYYGSTTDPDRATVLELGEGGRLENIDLLLPAPSLKRIITGIVLSQGYPAAGAWVSFKVTDYHYNSAGHSIQCDEEGRFAYPAAEGRRYSAMAAGIMSDGTPAHSETLQIPASGNADLSLELVPAKRPQNLLLDADAGEGFESQATFGSTNIESSAGCDASLAIRDGGYFQQSVPLAQDSEGQYAVLLGIALSEGMNLDGAITRPPSLYGLMESDQGRVTSHMQLQQALSSEREPNKRDSVYGIFRVPPGTTKISVSLNLDERLGVPQHDSAARLDGVGLYLLPTEIEAKSFVENCFNLKSRAVQFAQAQKPHKASARQVSQQRGVPIISLLRPGETQLTIVSAQRDPPLLVLPPPGTSLAAWLTLGSEVVMKARVESRLSMLSPDKDWIDTSVQIKILQVLKSTDRRSFYEGQEVSFMERGGSLEVEGRQIDAIVRWASRFEIGKEYLIFAGLNSANDLVTGAGSSYEIVHGASLRSLVKTEPSDSISESSLNSVLEEIQLHADVVK